MRDKKVLITKGSGSIGKALVAEPGQRGVRAIAVMGRRPELLDALAAEFSGVNFLVPATTGYCVAGSTGGLTAAPSMLYHTTHCGGCANAAVQDYFQRH
ncbi:hypothetical protein [Hymenobacter elongatus]|uniref:SDR family NAD(P)-dependent oxidoreductase n=1 Tax=Hymenobacter elongatus TaxID=877208 RepID=A0A4Z0PNF7_9BACT|nr:hypothetical protein [Hymenobacter elongatus]TGE17361.1 hypothetical protein E5J99_07285 [Hymenobacter elongatus]